MYAMHSVEMIEGIGPAYGETLRSHGIAHAEDLLFADVDRLVSDLDRAGDSHLRGLLPGFVHQAALMQVVDSGQFAEALYRNGIRDLNKLGWIKPEGVVDAIASGVQANLLKDTIELGTAIDWQKRAIHYGYTRVVCGRVLDGAAPVQGARIYWGTESAETTADGNFWLPGIPSGGQRVAIVADGYESKQVALHVDQQNLLRYNLPLRPVTDVDHPQSGEAVTRFGPEDYLKERVVEVDDLEPGQLWYVSYHYVSGEIKLNSITRTRYGSRVEILAMRLSAGALEDETTGTVYRWKDGAFEKASVSVAEARLAERRGE